ncbi:unnamed protein product [Cyprideis torosa]|uniref:Uncharacterized protein n=1 Tax=Cyprideis torosa TaxID=163714 RepID=A0A7R8ZQZ2_9CRUS|nr:unnamed protein product [Cyprideis torosa]CAG0904051.1 unnamed protein product [Cyprideis torosa]
MESKAEKLAAAKKKLKEFKMMKQHQGSEAVSSSSENVQATNIPFSEGHPGSAVPSGNTVIIPAGQNQNYSRDMSSMFGATHPSMFGDAHQTNASIAPVTSQSVYHVVDLQDSSEVFQPDERPNPTGIISSASTVGSLASSAVNTIASYFGEVGGRFQEKTLQNLNEQSYMMMQNED